MLSQLLTCMKWKAKMSSLTVQINLIRGNSEQQTICRAIFPLKTKWTLEKQLNQSRHRMISIKCQSHASKRSTSSTRITKAIVKSNQRLTGAVIKSHQSSTPTITQNDKQPISNYKATRSLKNNLSWKCRSIQLMWRHGSIIAEVIRGTVKVILLKRKLTSTIKSVNQDF